MVRRAPFFAAAAVALLSWSAPAPSAARTILVCEAPIPAAMVDTVDSANAFPGQRFRFRITAPSRLDGVIVPVGSTGYGFVREVSAASNRDRNGSLDLEARAVYVGNRELPVMADPRETALWAPATTLAETATGYIPIAGIIRTAVNEVRNGRNVKIGPGFSFHVVSVRDPRSSQPCRQVGS